MTLEAGPELDLAVAKACGIEVCQWSFCPQFWFTGSKIFAPSTDLNDAFLAAESYRKGKDWPNFRLFEQYHLCRPKYDENWAVCSIDVGGSHDYLDFGLHPTPCLAICAAILKLAENSHAQ